MIQNMSIPKSTYERRIRFLYVIHQKWKGGLDLLLFPLYLKLDKAENRSNATI